MLTASLPLIAFVFAGLFTPGPNVVMLTASGARFGFARTLPHLIGVPVGTAIIAAFAALGIGSLLLAVPALKLTLQIIAAGWILFLAYKTALAGRTTKADDRGRPFTLYEAVLFQAVNPKIWAVALAAAAGFGSQLPPGLEALRFFGIFFWLNLGVCLFWTTIGHLLSKRLNDPRTWRLFMRLMALLMALSATLIFI